MNGLKRHMCVLFHVVFDASIQCFSLPDEDHWATAMILIVCNSKNMENGLKHK